MRILLIGQAAFAEEVLERLVAAGDEMAAVLCPPDRGGRADPVKETAEARGIPIHQFASLKRVEARAAFEAAAADLAVLAYATQIVPEPLLSIPRLGSICFHPSLLPRYRGGSAIPWQLIRGETRSGVTVFWPDAGIDTGPILLQRSAAVGPDDTAASLYYETLFPLGLEAVTDAVALVREGRAPRERQDESRASHDPLLRDVHAGIDFARSTRLVHDLIRGCDPQPGAHTSWRGLPVRLFGSTRVAARRMASPGTVLGLDADGVTLATVDGAIRCARARADGPKGAAAEVLRALGVTPGAMLEPLA
jgi:methionyl-tRNA formyltransferase